LARKEIQINQAMHKGATPLYMACQNAHVKVVNALLVREEIQINQARDDGAIPLFIACEKDRVKEKRFKSIKLEMMEQHHCTLRVRRIV
jgi:hypothetical protein